MPDWDDNSDPELPEAWGDDDGESLTRPCPQCGCDVYEDAERCPLCGEWMTRTRTAWEGRPLWWIILGFLGIGAVIYALIPH
jgi:hypothetical protein